MQIEEIKRFLPEYLTGKGINLRKGGACPVCGNGTKTPCFHYNARKEQVKCFSCGFSGDLIDLIGVEYGLDNSEAINKAKELYSDRKPVNKAPVKESPAVDYTEFITECALNVSNTSYFKERGLSDTTIKDFNLGYEPAFKNAIIPYPGENYYFKRGTQSDFKGKARGQEPLFNLQDLYNKEAQPVFICEGQIDALSFIECRAYAIALGSTERVNALLSQLRAKPVEVPLIIATDADEAGERASEALQKGFNEIGVLSSRFCMLESCKDPNDCLKANRKAFESAIDETIDKAFSLEDQKQKEFAEPYKEAYSINLIDSFIAEIQEKKNKGIATGFRELDKALDGGIFPGLFIIGAESSLGKSTIILNMAEQIAERGTDVIYFSLEMAKRELMARSISKLSFIGHGCNLAHPGNKTTKEILKGNPADYMDAIESYKPIAKNLVLYEDQSGINVKELCNYVENHHKATGKTPVVILDYLQLIAPINPSDTDKYKMDYTVKALKQLSQKLNTPVIAISSVNREGYGSRVTMRDFKESGAIEFSSDVLMGLNLGITITKNKPEPEDVDNALKCQPREMILEILKNRNGERNQQIKFEYYSAYNYFSDNIKGLQNWQDKRQGAKPQKF